VKWVRALLWSLAIATLVVVAGGPLAGAWIVRGRVIPKLEARLGRRVTVEHIKVRWGLVELRQVVVDGAGGSPPVVVPLVRVRLRVGALLAGRVEVAELELQHPRLELQRGGAEDNVSSILERLRAPRAEATSDKPRAPMRIDRVRIVDAAAAVSDVYGEAQVTRLDAELSTDGPGEARLYGPQAHLAAGPRASAGLIKIGFTLEHGKLAGLPTVEVEAGAASPFRGLDLTGITGAVRPDVENPRRAVVEVRGSYGGADATLWNATGWLDPEREQGLIKLRADRFKLSQLESVWSREGAVTRVMNAKNAEVDAHLDLTYSAGTLTYAGAFHLAGLTIAHPMLGPQPVAHVSLEARARGTLDFQARRLRLVEAVVDFRNVHATFTADVENLGPKPRFAATLQVRPLPCQVALQALPPELTPSLQGFKLTGTFSTDLHLALDMDDLDSGVDLGGKVGIEGCKSIEAPEAVSADRLQQTFVQTVEPERGKWFAFLAGPENPDFVPYDQISRHLVNSIMTTEDNGFFKHHGFIPSEFRSALQQNLQRGYFRLGASSITMQMIKNVLLTREKTLSRKLQELFLTWYIEHQLTKERILEIYFNVIEFGPGIYGIGRAARHYFGKPAKELAPQEAAFFSSILPNPKRRYVQYCHKEGTLDAKWDAYIKRIMRRMHERGRLTDEEFAHAQETPLRFSRVEAMPEKECMALVKRITTSPQQLAQQSAK
jgi:Transglycosylase